MEVDAVHVNLVILGKTVNEIFEELIVCQTNTTEAYGIKHKAFRLKMMYNYQTLCIRKRQHTNDNGHKAEACLQALRKLSSVMPWVNKT